MENIVTLSESFLLLTTPTADQMEFVDQANEALAAYGLKMKLQTRKDKITGEKYGRLVIDVKRSWNPSGRPKVGGDKDISPNRIRKMMETMSAADVAAELGISRSTLFRRLKESE